MANLMDFKIEILKQEIEIISEKVNHFDHLRHQTKQMAVTLWAAALGVGITAKSPTVHILAALVPIPFWISEAFYHAYQEGFYARLLAIRSFIGNGQYNVRGKDMVNLEECFKSGTFGAFPVPDHYGGHTLPPESHARRTSVRRNFLKPKMLLFYVPLVVAALLFALLFYVGVLKTP